MKMKQGVYTLLFTLLGCLVMLPPAWAAADSTAKSYYTLGEVVVSNKKMGVEATATTREVTAEQIANSGAETLNEALRLLPGIDIKIGGHGTPRINIRGMRTRHVILLIDGVPYNSAYDGQFDPSRIPVENIARIKVSCGTHSVLYGEGGLGGVINIITKKGGQKLAGHAALEGGQQNRWLTRANISGGNETADFFLSGSAMSTDGYRLADGFTPTVYEDGGLRNNSDKLQRSFFANGGFTPSDDLNLGVIFNYVTGRYGIPSSIYDNSDPFASNPKYERVDDFESFTGQVSGDYNLPGPFDARANIFYNRLREFKNRYDDDTYTTQVDTSIKGLYSETDISQIMGANLQVGCDLASWGLITVALSSKFTQFDTEGKIVEKKNKPFVPFDNLYHVENHFVAAEYETKFFKKLGLVLGYSHHWFKKDNGDQDDQNSLLGGLSYDILSNLRIRGSVAKKIRFPSVSQLYDTTSGNTALTSEKSMNYEVGLDYSLPRQTTLSVAVFHIDVEDFIEKDNTTNIYENHDEYRFQGIELSAATGAIKDLTLRSSLTLMKSEDRSAGTTQDELQYRPEVKFTLDATYKLWFGFTIHADLDYEYGNYFYSKSGTTQKRRLPEYTIVNVRLEKRLFSNQVKLYVGVDNILDDDYMESYGLPREGRSYYGGVEFFWD